MVVGLFVKSCSRCYCRHRRSKCARLI